MNKLFYRFFIIILLVFSFYYTNKIIEFLKEKDPIMKDIKKTSDKYKIDSIDAVITNDTIVPGKTGKEIDYKKSYSKMKQYGSYNEVLTVLKDVVPSISIEDNYDKYIVRGNKKNRKVSLVFKVYKDTYIDNILSILNKKNEKANFFVDGTYLEHNVLKLKNMKNHEINILSYNNSYDESLFKTSISYLENITGKGVNYCYSEKNNKELLDLCKKNKIHTIKPTIYIKKDLYKEIKINLDNSIIIGIDVNNYNEKALAASIDYIKQKGYKIVGLKELLSESNI